MPDADLDEASAERLLRCLGRRAVTGTNPATVCENVARVEAAAGAAAADRRRADGFFSLVDAYADVKDRRDALDATVADLRNEGRGVAALNWTTELGARSSASLDDLQQAAGIGRPDSPPVVAQILTTVRTAAWLIGLWSETEQTKGRRDYLAEAHGRPEPLPPRWLAACSVAADSSGR